VVCGGVCLCVDGNYNNEKKKKKVCGDDGDWDRE